jgi:hypothetical protein
MGLRWALINLIGSANSQDIKCILYECALGGASRGRVVYQLSYGKPHFSLL